MLEKSPLTMPPWKPPPAMGSDHPDYRTTGRGGRARAAGIGSLHMSGGPKRGGHWDTRGSQRRKHAPYEAHYQRPADSDRGDWGGYGELEGKSEGTCGEAVEEQPGEANTE